MCRVVQPAFDRVISAGLTLPGVVVETKYDGSPVLKLHGCFVAGVATHCSADPDTLVVRCSQEDRESMIADAPDVYYLTDKYSAHPVLLARLSRLDADALRDLLRMSWQLTDRKRGGRYRRGNGAARSRERQPTLRRSP
jgi:hypothetical protein